MTLLGIRLSIEEVSPDIIGWILVCYSIGFVVGTLYVHRIIGRVGHIRAFAVFAAMAAVAALLYPMAVSAFSGRHCEYCRASASRGIGGYRKLVF